MVERLPVKEMVPGSSPGPGAGQSCESDNIIFYWITMPEDLNQIQKFKIKNRESWFKTIVLSALSVVIIFKFVGGSFRVDLSALGFTDVLSLFLALFSIFISALFYFKATDTSNEFYNNTYKFTQEMSKILERIHSEFGEKLSNIQQAQSQAGFKKSSNETTNPELRGTSEKPEKIEEPQEPTPMSAPAPVPIPLPTSNPAPTSIPEESPEPIAENTREANANSLE